MRETMTMNDDTYDYECGSCKSTKLDWIEYDPDTAKGRKNRKKYCIPAAPNPRDYDLEAGMAELKAEYERLIAEEPVK